MVCGPISGGSGHRFELHGGPPVISIRQLITFGGFQLRPGRNGDDTSKVLPIDDTDEDTHCDTRVAPVRRLVQRLVDTCESGGSPSPGAAEGYRVQCLIEARDVHKPPVVDRDPSIGRCPTIEAKSLSARSELARCLKQTQTNAAPWNTATRNVTKLSKGQKQKRISGGSFLNRNTCRLIQ
jgi:hypothetical protein